MNTITPETFLNIVFELMRNNPHEVVYSVRTGDKWQNKYYGGRRRKIPIGTSATYYCVSTCKRDPSYPRRNRQTVREAWVVPFDDIGTKAREPSVEPSYKIETSVGNYQWGYLIHPFDVSTPEGQLAYDTVLYSAVKAGLNDPGCRSATRVVRLPGSLHKTGFVARVTHWQPERVWELENLLGALGVEKVVPASGVSAEPGKHSRLEDVTDPVYHWLVDSQLAMGHNSDWVHILCPWRDSHTGGVQGEGATGYSPEEYSTMSPSFKCFHGHCAEKTTRDFRDWLLAQGCPVEWGEVDINAEEIRARIAQIIGEQS
jgi:hypothetical protein